MKKLFSIFVLCFLFTIKANCQTYDTTLTGAKYAKITGVKATFKDPLNCTRIGISIADDDLTTRVIINVSLADSLGNVYYRIPALIDGNTYVNWNRSINQLFNFVANKVGVTLK